MLMQFSLSRHRFRTHRNYRVRSAGRLVMATAVFGAYDSIASNIFWAWINRERATVCLVAIFGRSS
ncbi:hypothetical protein MPLSOD_260097 [Mesorhizobium sp. SOD10]|nr:hypothetical protein MPLSOD_260097 [Mesorhizobium sp. SOD10]